MKFNVKIAKFPDGCRKISKFIDKKLLGIGVWRGAKECKSSRSRKMLKNDYLVAKIGVDTAENEPRKE